MKPRTAYNKEEFHRLFYERNMELTRSRLRESVKEDTLIIHAINNMTDIEVTANTLIKDLREWYEIYATEVSRGITEHKKFVESISKNSREELMNSMGIRREDSVGADLREMDIVPIINLANHIRGIYRLMEDEENYIDKLMRGYCPNLREVAGTVIGAILIRHAGSLKSLMEMPSSKIQLLGAEKALFRHMKSGTKPPKFGIIFGHPLIQKSPRQKQGKIARTIAGKICIAVRVDYFKGEFIGDKLSRVLADKFNSCKND